jgi:demethylmenaquinone methyltransferase / 2-methoxy-6-polyprenyl-1,4-benzoquinol methylase
MIEKTIPGPSEKLPPHPPLTQFYPAPSQRARFVCDLFDRAARNYNWMSSVLSLGSDRAYRRRALRNAGVKPGMRVLDVATGTGLVAQAALDLGIASGQLVGLDPSLGMLEENRKRRAIRLAQGVGERLPFRDQMFDFVVMGYALRHVEDLGGLFAEFHRVSAREGRVLILEITRPASRLGFGLLRLYLQRALPFLARLATGHRDSARLLEYYWATIAECVPPSLILAALSGAGFKPVARTARLGILSEYRAAKDGR